MSILILKAISLSILVCVVAMNGQSPVAASLQSNTWTRYGAEGFSVLLPEQPSSIEIDLPSGIREARRSARLFSAYEDRVVYVVLAFDNRNHRDPLSRFIDETSEYNISARAERFQQDLSGAGFTGKEYGFSYGPTLNGIVRFYLAGKRVYVVEAVGDDVTKPAVKQFLNSFSIGSDDRAESTLDANSPTPGPDRTEPQTTQSKAEIFPGKEVTLKARVVVKPEPRYTESARQAQLVGTVVLRGVFTSTGRVTNLRAYSGLPNGLTEQAIEAAKSIKFIPAMKDGRSVSMWIQLEYTFNLY